MANLSVLVLGGDGIGPEVTVEAVRVLAYVAERAGIELALEEALFGGAAIDDSGDPAPESALSLAAAADAVLLGAVGGPKWDHLPTAKRPERGLMRIRERLELYANLRPARLFESLEGSCPLRPERASGLDFVVVRELVGGIYFGQPRGRSGGGVSGEPRRGFNTMVYDENEIRRLGRVAFETAMRRQRRVTSVDKANVLEVQGLWREVMIELREAEYPEIALDHLYVDNCAMQLILDPTRFDVIATGNMFGDILSDAAAGLTGSIGLLPSASLGENSALYEPVHGSAPDITGQGVANPLAAIMSVAMLLEHSAGRRDLASWVDTAVEAVLAAGLRTGDLMPRGQTSQAAVERVGTVQMGDAVLAQLMNSEPPETA